MGLVIRGKRMDLRNVFREEKEEREKRDVFRGLEVIGWSSLFFCDLVCLLWSDALFEITNIQIRPSGCAYNRGMTLNFYSHSLFPLEVPILVLKRSDPSRLPR